MIKLIVDTREQKPFVSTGVTFKALKVGDYTTELLLNKFHIERKSLNDLYGTITKGHARFRREILRAEDNRIKLVVVVEGTHDQFINKRFDWGSKLKIEGETLRKIVETIKRRYKLEFIFCRTRTKAKETTLKRLRHEEKRLKARVRIKRKVTKRKNAKGNKRSKQ